MFLPKLKRKLIRNFQLQPRLLLLKHPRHLHRIRVWLPVLKLVLVVSIRANVFTSAI